MLKQESCEYQVLLESDQDSNPSLPFYNRHSTDPTTLADDIVIDLLILFSFYSTTKLVKNEQNNLP